MEKSKIPFIIDTEFIEEPGSIQLISVGIVAPFTNDLFYRVSKEFDFDKVWNDDWLRENVLRTIFNDYVIKIKDFFEKTGKNELGDIENQTHYDFTKEMTKMFIDNLGATKKEMKDEVIAFIGKNTKWLEAGNPSFYGWYAAYDWVVFCWIFGRMIDLPEAFPMYIKDIKQLVEELGITKEEIEKNIPQNTNKHHALSDAIWEANLLNYIAISLQKKYERKIGFNRS